MLLLANNNLHNQSNSNMFSDLFEEKFSLSNEANLEEEEAIEVNFQAFQSSQSSQSAQSSLNLSILGEVVGASTDRFIAECPSARLYQPPSFGSFVKISPQLIANRENPETNHGPGYRV